MDNTVRQLCVVRGGADTAGTDNVFLSYALVIAQPRKLSNMY